MLQSYSTVVHSRPRYKSTDGVAGPFVAAVRGRGTRYPPAWGLDNIKRFQALELSLFLIQKTGRKREHFYVHRFLAGQL